MKTKETILAILKLPVDLIIALGATLGVAAFLIALFGLLWLPVVLLLRLFF